MRTSFLLVALVVLVFSLQIGKPLSIEALPLSPTPIKTEHSKIAFDGRSNGVENIYLLDVDTSNMTVLTDHYASFPVWSPDGQHIAFISTTSVGWGIYLMNEDGSHVAILTNDGTFPAWSPDGQYIAFVSVRAGWPYQYLMKADGSGQQRLAQIYTTFQPSWSPDSKFVTFATSKENIYEMDIKNLSIRWLTKFGLGPVWSPDGKSIAFSAYREGGAWYIYIMNTDGSHEHNLTPNFAGDVGSPAWSPDGRYIAFKASVLSDSLWKTELYIMNPDGSNSHALLKGVEVKDDFVWSPTSEYLAFGTTCKDGPGIDILRIEDSYQQCILTNGIMPKDLAWMP